MGKTSRPQRTRSNIGQRDQPAGRARRLVRRSSTSEGGSSKSEGGSSASDGRRRSPSRPGFKRRMTLPRPVLPSGHLPSVSTVQHLCCSWAGTGLRIRKCMRPRLVY
jgi:hypothetical protein